jgi:rSAM/selenodomain-associated transferase 1
MTTTSNQVQLLVMAKTPVPGRVKTRLCPPATPESAARIAAAALSDTLDTVAATPAAHHTLVLADLRDSDMDSVWTPDDRPAPVTVVPQRGDGLADRLANAYADTARPAGPNQPNLPTLLIGMDTPQVTAELLAAATDRLTSAAGPVDAVLGMAADGGWWTLGLNDPRHAEALRGVPMSTPDTGQLTLAALERRGLRVVMLPVLRDVDTAADAWAVAAARPGGRFGRAVARLLPHDPPDQIPSAGQAGQAGPTAAVPRGFREELLATGSGGLA